MANCYVYLLAVLKYLTSPGEFSPGMCQRLAICHPDVPDFRKKGTTKRFFKGVIVVPRYWLFRSLLLLQDRRFLFPTMPTSRAPDNGEFIIGSIASQLLPIIRRLSTTIVLYCGALCCRTTPGYSHLSFIFRWQASRAQMERSNNVTRYQIAKIFVCYVIIIVSVCRIP